VARVPAPRVAPDTGPAPGRLLRRASARAAAEEAGRAVLAALEQDRATDELTGLPSRAALRHRIATAQARAEVVGGRPALLAVGLDRLDDLAAAVGTATRDELLRHVGRRLRAFTPAEDVVARIGPDRFAVLVEGVDGDGCAGMAARMLALLEEPMRHDGRTLALGCSIGTARDTGTQAPQDLLAAAEEALLEARRSPGTRWVEYDPGVHERAVARAVQEQALRRAVRGAAVEVTIESVLRLRPVEGAVPAAVARWSVPAAPGVPALPPDAVARAVDEAGLGGDLGRIVLGRALDASVSEGVAVPIGRCLLEDRRLVPTVVDALAARQLPAAALWLLVTAGTPVESRTARSTLATLRALGVRLVLAGFGGAGPAPAAVRDLPVDALVLDPRLTADLGADRGVVAALVALCRSLGPACLADGVGSAEHLEVARALGIAAVLGPDPRRRGPATLAVTADAHL
jgi:diguanylate cyclase (GGDEF)-like protein